MARRQGRPAARRRPPGPGQRPPRAVSRRGQARRDAILEAALAVIADDGAGGLTHRAVAARARVPLAATTYYFSSRTELLVAAFRRLVGERIAVLDAAIVATPARMSAELAAAAWSQVMADNLQRQPGRLIAELELHLHAGRIAELRALHLEWEARAMAYFEVALHAIGSPSPRLDAAIVLAALTGLQTGELAAPTAELERDLTGPVLRRLLLALAPRRGQSRFQLR